MTLLGLDLSGTRLRAVQGPLGDFAVPCAPLPGCLSVPTLFNLESSTPEYGPSGVRLVRAAPHLVAHDFLVHLGEPRRWRAGRQELDAASMVGHLFQAIAPMSRKCQGIAVSLPPYLSRWQADLVRSIGERAKLPVLGTLPSTLAAALAGFAQQQWHGAVLVLDLDDHALSLALVRAVDQQAHLLAARHFPHLGLHLWKRRLLDCLADMCVRQSRRDPRASALAEQGLYEQLDPLIDACRQGRMVQLTVAMQTWLQNLVVTPEQTLAFCAPLIHAACQEVQGILNQTQGEDVPTHCLLTAEAARLPGLGYALARLVEGEPRPDDFAAVPHIYQEDFGDDLLHTSGEDRSCVALLGVDGLARAAHGLVAHFRHDLDPGHLELVAPLPLAQSEEAGPPRLHYQGEDFFLETPNFFLGTQMSCHLAFDGVRYPTVAARHCEILTDHRTSVLFNRSQGGTLVNDYVIQNSVVLRAGDRIRLGQQGPIVRFLGQGKAS